MTNAAVAVLGAAIALYVAVHLIEQIVPALIALTGLAALGYAVWFFHSRRGGW
jgi:hypothetical protein